MTTARLGRARPRRKMLGGRTVIVATCKSDRAASLHNPARPPAPSPPRTHLSWAGIGEDHPHRAGGGARPDVHHRRSGSLEHEPQVEVCQLTIRPGPSARAGPEREARVAGWQVVRARPVETVDETEVRPGRGRRLHRYGRPVGNFHDHHAALDAVVRALRWQPDAAVMHVAILAAGDVAATDGPGERGARRAPPPLVMITVAIAANTAPAANTSQRRDGNRKSLFGPKLISSIRNWLSYVVPQDLVSDAQQRAGRQSGRPRLSASRPSNRRTRCGPP